MNGSNTGIRDAVSVSEDNSVIGGSGLENFIGLGDVHIGDFMSKLHSLAVPIGDMGVATGIGTFW